MPSLDKVCKLQSRKRELRRFGSEPKTAMEYDCVRIRISHR